MATGGRSACGPWLGWSGGACIVTGLGCGGSAAAAGNLSVPLGVGLGVLTLLALMLGSAVLDSSKGQEQDQDQDSDRGAGRSRRRWAIAVAAIAAPVSGYVGWQVSSEVAAGLPGRGLPLLAFGLALVALGGVLVALVPSSEGLPVRPGARPGPSIRPVAATILAGALFSAAHGVATMVEEAPVDSAVAAPVGWPEPPAAPEAVRWETDRELVRRYG